MRKKELCRIEFGYYICLCSNISAGNELFNKGIGKHKETDFRCIVYDNCSGAEVRNMLQEYVKRGMRFSLTYFDNTVEHVIMWEYGIPEILHMAGAGGGFFSIVDVDDELNPDGKLRRII